MTILFNKNVANEPPYQLTELQETVKKLESEGRFIINATIGDPKDDTPNQIRNNVISAIKKQSFSQYPKYIGSDSLRKEMANWANKNMSISLDPDKHMLACNGTKEAIFSLPLLFDWQKGQYILIPDLSYPVYKQSAKILNINTFELPLMEENNFLPQLEKIPEEILSNTQLFWINSPHNPTSSIASFDELNALVQLAEKYNFLVCSDECYNDLYSDKKPASILDIDSSHWICFRSLSKRSHMTGYRSGAIFSKNESLIKNLKKMRSPMGVGTPSFIQHAAEWAWSDEQHVRNHRELYNRKRTQIKAALIAAGLDVFGGEAGFYMWVKSKNHSTSDALCQWFLDRDILVTPGTVFGDNGNPFVRIVFCLRQETIDIMCANIQSK